MFEDLSTSDFQIPEADPAEGDGSFVYRPLSALVLAYIQKYGPTSTKQLANATGVTEWRVRNAAKGWVEKGLLEVFSVPNRRGRPPEGYKPVTLPEEPPEGTEG